MYIAIFHLSTMTICLAFENNAITHKLSGRFGDNIYHYSKVKWLSFKYNIPLLYKPWKYSDKLTMHTLEIHYTSDIEKQFNQLIGLKNNVSINVDTISSTLFVHEGHLHDPQFKVNSPENILYEYMVRYPQFAQELKKMLQPVISMPLLDLPSDKITVAVHVRKGSGHDKPLASIQQYSNYEQLVSYEKELRLGHFSDKVPIWATKFPPEQYYIDQIKKLSSLLNDAPLFVYIFTDAKNPNDLIKKLEQIINKPNITFAYRENNTFNYQNQIIEDYYNMAQFDCLIRSSSRFSLAAQLLGNHKIIIYPKHARWIGNKLVVDKIGIIVRTNLIDQLKGIHEAKNYQFNFM